MAVYTVLDRDDVVSFIEPFGVGPLVSFEGVAAGIENTNYFVTTDQSDFPSEQQTEPSRHFVLTIFEYVDSKELAFFVELTSLLNQRGLPVPCPLTDADGHAMQSLHSKPALLIPKLEGEHPQQATIEQCHEIGLALAHVHQACLDAELQHQSGRGLGWLAQCAEQIKTLLDSADQELLEEIPRFLELVKDQQDLPQSIIHGDLFRDNALFNGNTISGIIDFNNAGSGFLALDLAITVNDWCSEPDGSIHSPLSEALLAGYEQIRPLTQGERRLWNDFLRIAAARFWLSRLYSQLLPESSHRPGGLVELKDPQQYKNILLHRIHSPQLLS